MKYGIIIAIVIVIGILAFLVFSRKKRTTGDMSTKAGLWKNHIPELIAGLYLNHIRKYPNWQSIAPEYMPECITAVTADKNGAMKIILNLREYELRFKEWSYDSPDGHSHTHGLLEIFTLGDKKVFGVLLAKGRAGNTLRWEASEIEAFTPGPWLDDFQHLASEILAIIRQKKLEAHEG